MQGKRMLCECHTRFHIDNIDKLLYYVTQGIRQFVLNHACLFQVYNFYCYFFFFSNLFCVKCFILVASSSADRSSDLSNSKPFERLKADQPELLEGIDDLNSKDAKDGDRMANAAQTGEGHIGHYDSVDATHAYLIIEEK